MIVTYPNDKSLMIDLAFARLGNCLRWPFVFLQLSAFAVFSHGSPLEKLDGVSLKTIIKPAARSNLPVPR